MQIKKIIKEEIEMFEKEFWKLTGEYPLELDSKQKNFLKSSNERVISKVFEEIEILSLKANHNPMMKDGKLYEGYNKGYDAAIQEILQQIKKDIE